MDTIVVEPLARGWAVRTDTVDNPMVFKTGRAAEETARGLAFRLAQAGRLVRLRLKLRNSSTEARFVCLPPARADSAAKPRQPAGRPAARVGTRLAAVEAKTTEACHPAKGDGYAVS